MTEPVVHVDEGYVDLSLARLYDAECPWHAQDDFYLALDLAAGSVLDVGCGTGTRLVRAREVGHRGVLVGADPAPGMLTIARGKSTHIEWVPAAAQTLDVQRRFDLVTMTGHAFQTLLDDASVLAALHRFREHLQPDGLLAFETRNPEPRGWEDWTENRTRAQIEAPDGVPFETWVDDPRHDGRDLVTFTSATLSQRTGALRTSRCTLRFIDPNLLRDHLTNTGFRIEGWYGNWDRSPVTQTSPEVIVLASPA